MLITQEPSQGRIPQAPKTMYLAWLALVGKNPWELAKDCPKGRSLGKGY